MDRVVTHLAPPDGGDGLMPCCGLTPFEARADKMTTDRALVTCGTPQLVKPSPTVYVTADSRQWLVLTSPDGLVPPPTVTLHQPLVGPVEFYYAQCYNLPVPAEAKAMLETMERA